MLVLLLAVVSVAATTVTTNIPEHIPQDLNQTVNIAVSDNSSTCILTIYDDEGTNVYTNSTSFNPLVDQSIFANRGHYSSVADCSNGTSNFFYTQHFTVTKNGFAPAESIFEALIYLLFIFASLLLFYTLMLTMVKLVTATETVYDAIMAWSSYILLMIVNYLGGEYLLRTYVETLSGTFMTLTPWTNVVLPMFALIWTIFRKATEKKKPLTVEQIGGFGRG